MDSILGFTIQGFNANDVGIALWLLHYSVLRSPLWSLVIPSTNASLTRLTSSQPPHRIHIDQPRILKITPPAPYTIPKIARRSSCTFAALSRRCICTCAPSFWAPLSASLRHDAGGYSGWCGWFAGKSANGCASGNILCGWRSLFGEGQLRVISVERMQANLGSFSIPGHSNAITSSRACAAPNLMSENCSL